MPCLDVHIKVRNDVKVHCMQNLSNLPPGLNASLFKTNVGVCGVCVYL